MWAIFPRSEAYVHYWVSHVGQDSAPEKNTTHPTSFLKLTKSLLRTLGIPKAEEALFNISTLIFLFVFINEVVYMKVLSKLEKIFT